MKKMVLLAVISSFVASVSFAADLNTVSVKGTIIDNLCAVSQKPEDLPGFVKTYTKECALAPSCAANGYSIFSGGKLINFDKESSAKIEEFLGKSASKLQVTVIAKKTGDSLHLIAIENQE